MILSEKRLPLIGAEGKLRSYVDIEKVISCIIAAETRGVSGESYLISDKQPLTTKQFYRTLASGLNKEIRTLPLPLFLARFAEKTAFWSGKLNRHVKVFNVLGEFGRHHVVNPQKAELELGVAMLENSELGLKEMARRFLTK